MAAIVQVSDVCLHTRRRRVKPEVELNLSLSLSLYLSIYLFIYLSISLSLSLSLSLSFTLSHLLIVSYRLHHLVLSQTPREKHLVHVRRTFRR